MNRMNLLTYPDINQIEIVSSIIKREIYNHREE